MHRCTQLLVVLGAWGAASPSLHGQSDADKAAALLTRHCLPCHSAAGAAPIRLDSPESIRRNRGLAAALVDDGTMPPSLPTATDHIRPRFLSETDRRLIVDALRGGGGIPVQPRVGADSEAAVCSPDSAWTMPASGGARLRTFSAPVPEQRVRGLRFADPHELSRSPIRLVSLAPDPGRSLRRLDATDGEAGIEAMGNIGASPSGAIGALSRTCTSFELPAGFHFAIPAGDVAIETLCEPIGRPAEVLPRIAWIAASESDSRPVRALAMPVTDLAVEGGTCTTSEVRRQLDRPIDIVAVIAKGGAFLRTVSVEAGGKRVLEIADFRMAFNEPWLLRHPLRVEPRTPIVARLGFDNTSSNPQQPFNPPRTVTAGLPPSSEDAIVVILYADAPASR